ncbi:unnamed protein product [Mycena citricolor]|uniref:Profilin n=1 Tax=Mycena citricolor TaxID=2018698 RepID=A0AAD2K1W1_9AGAR|nr:unnamed protein product [Mycena citricolor]
MSWQTYVDTNLGSRAACGRPAPGSRHVSLSLSAFRVRSSPARAQLSAEEQKAITAAHNNTDSVLASGVRLAGTKYFATQADARSIYGKKGGDGCVLVKTKQAILVTEYVLPAQAGEAVKVVEELADYLIGVGY